MTTLQREDDAPWYRQFWPWFLIALPLASVLGGLATVVIALNSRDGLVVDDYYKEGLAINRVLARDRRAAELGLTAAVNLDSASGEVSARVVSRVLEELPPERLRLSLQHPTRAHMDQSLELHWVPDGAYAGTLAPLAEGNWYLLLEPVAGDWRLTGRLSIPGDDRVRLVPPDLPS
jgi:hypothetical protein